MADLKFISCTQAQYNAQLSATTLVTGALYFTSDTRHIYRATSTSVAELYCQPFEVITSYPSTGQKQGTLYINSITYEVKIWNGSSWVTVSLPITSTIDSNSTNSQIPTAKAVYDAIPQTGTTAGTVPVLDSNGKLANSVIPELAITRCAGTVNSKNALTTLSNAEVGDYAVVAESGTASEDGVYFLNGICSTLSNWVKISGTGSTIVLDDNVTQYSSNGVKSSGIYTALQTKANASHTHSASTDISGLATVATTGAYNDLASKLEWINL